MRFVSCPLGAPAKRQNSDIVRGSLRKPEKWCNWKGGPIDVVGPGTAPTLVAKTKVFACPCDAVFRNPTFFVPGELHRHAEEWKSIPNAPQEILSYVIKGVDAWSFVRHFKVNFGGKNYDAPSP